MFFKDMKRGDNLRGLIIKNKLMPFWVYNSYSSAFYEIHILTYLLESIFFCEYNSLSYILGKVIFL